MPHRGDLCRDAPRTTGRVTHRTDPALAEHGASGAGGIDEPGQQRCEFAGALMHARLAVLGGLGHSGMAQGTRSVGDPADAYQVLGSLAWGLASLEQSLTQLADFYAGPAVRRRFVWRWRRLCW